MRRTTVSWLVLLLLSPATALAGPGGDWYGEVEYTLDTTYERKNELNDCKDVTAYHEIRAARVRFCGRNAARVESRARYDLKYAFDRRCEEELWTCKRGNQPHVVRPGNKRSEDHDRNARVDWRPLEKLELGFSLAEDGSAFHLAAKGYQTFQTMTVFESSRTDACTGEKTKDLPDRHVTGKDRWGMSVILDEKTQNGFSKGRKPVGQPIPDPHAKKTEEVSWFVVSPCGRIRYQFAHALAAVEEYRHELLTKKPSSVKELEDGVDKETGAKTEYGVLNDTCQLWDVDANRELTPEEFRRKLAEDYLCAPSVVHESVFQHEMTHKRQCENQKGTEFSDPTPEEQYKSERESYCIEAGILLPALEQCGGANQWEKRNYKSTCLGK